MRGVDYKGVRLIKKEKVSHHNIQADWKWACYPEADALP